MSSESDELDLLESDLLAQTAQIVVQVRDRLADITRREQTLHAQVAMLDVDRRNLRTERAKLQAESDGIILKLTEREAALARTTDELAQQQRELAIRLIAVEERDAQFAGEYARLVELQESEAAQVRQECAVALQRTMEERESLEIERSQFERQRLGLLAELQRQRQAFEFALAVERQRASDQISEKNLADQIKSDRECLDRERDRFRSIIDDWHAQQAGVRAQFEKDRDEICRERLQAEEEIRTLREDAFTEIELERAKLQRDLDARRSTLNDDLRQAEAEVKRVQALNESRTRFHQERLERSKHELELAHNSLRHEYQRLRQGIEAKATLARNCDLQLRRHRSALDVLAASLDRQQDTLHRMHAAMLSEANAEKQRLSIEREAESLRQEQCDIENLRQSDLISQHAHNLEARRDRLDQLRSELESRHEEILECRLAVDEAWAQLAQVTGSENAKLRVESSRLKLSELLSDLRISLQSDREQLAAMRADLSREKNEFLASQQQAMESLAARRSQLKIAESQHAAKANEQAHSQQQWSKERATWLRERLEAERVIRQLITQLGSTLATAAQHPHQDCENALFPLLPTTKSEDAAA